MERSTRARRASTILAAALAVALGGAGLPAAANAATASAATHAYRHGVVPMLGSTTATATPPAAGPQAAARLRTSNLHYGGGIGGVGVTTGPPRVYLVFWGSQWGTAATNAQGYMTLSGDPSGMAPYFQAFIKGLGTNSELWSGVMTQYCEGVTSGSTTCPATAPHVGYPAGAALAGVWADTAAAAPGAATGHQLGAEAVSAAAHFGNTTAAANRNVQYMIISPTGTQPDGFNTPGGGFCAWHDYTGDSTLTGGAVSSPAGPLAFTNLPYVTDATQSCGMNFVNAGSAGALDGVSIVGGHEYAETITDQYPLGGWSDSSGNENADKCAWVSSGTGAARNLALATGTFAVQTTWGNDLNSGAGGCEASHAIVTSNTTSDFSIGASPTTVSVTQGSTATAAISTAVTGGSAQTVSLSASGLPSGAGASFNPASVTAGGSSTVTFSAAATTAAGTYPVTVTGTGAAGPTHSVSISLAVKAPAANDFSISASPASLSVTQGSNGQSTISTAVTSGSAQTVSLAAGGLPAGVTASFSPASLTAGAASTLTLTAASGATTGPATVTVTGTGTSQTHTTSLALTVNPPVSGPLVANGGFETGNLTGWTASGPAEAVVSPGHSGSYAARLGSTAATNANSTIQQTIAVPSGGGTLTFWYQAHCGDLLRNDQQQMQIHATTGGTLATELSVCDRSGIWKQVSVSLASFGGRQIVLWFNNYDSNQWLSGPSYFLVDDVTVTATGAGVHRSGRPASTHHGRR